MTPATPWDSFKTGFLDAIALFVSLIVWAIMAALILASVAIFVIVCIGIYENGQRYGFMPLVVILCWMLLFIGGVFVFVRLVEWSSDRRHKVRKS